jgi:hypothetical protein
MLVGAVLLGAVLSGAPQSPALCVDPAGVYQALLGAGRLTREEDHCAGLDVKEERVAMTYSEKQTAEKRLWKKIGKRIGSRASNCLLYHCHHIQRSFLHEGD